MKKIAIVGAGFSGAVVAHQIADAHNKVTVFESRSHIGGNCHTERDGETGVMVHMYGPHIFHTDNEDIWRYVNQFGEFEQYVNRVKAIANNKVYTLPINLLTINQFFGKTYRPAEARAFIETISDKSFESPSNFEQQALHFMGEELYKTFFEGYTLKQWGIHPRSLPARILKRLPLRFNYDDNYYNHKYQGIPKYGYTKLIERMLDVPGVDLHFNTIFDSSKKSEFDHVFYSGPIDAWFGYINGRLPYRTLDFEIIRDNGDYQGNAVINYCDQSIPYTRITEHKHFTPWENHEKTICYREYSRACGEDDIPYYPIRLAGEMNQHERYEELAKQEEKVTFIGRLGTYRYLDMDATIYEALKASKDFKKDKAI